MKNVSYDTITLGISQFESNYYMKIQVLVFKIWEQIFSDLCGLSVFDNTNHFALEMNECLNNWVCRFVQTLVKESLNFFSNSFMWYFWNIRGLQLSHRKFMTKFFYFCCYILISYYSEEYQMGNFIHWQSALTEKGFGVIELMVNLCYLSKTFVSLNFRIAL